MAYMWWFHKHMRELTCALYTIHTNILCMKMCRSSLAGLLTWFVTFWPPFAICTNRLIVLPTLYACSKHTKSCSSNTLLCTHKTCHDTQPDDTCIKHTESLDLSRFSFSHSRARVHLPFCILCIGLMTVWSNIQNTHAMDTHVFFYFFLHCAGVSC